MGEQTSNYPTLRRTRTVLRMIAPILSVFMSLAGLSLFLGFVPQLTTERYALSERMIFGVIALSYLIGLPLVGFVLHFVLRAGADLIDVWIDNTVASEKTADLMERQLVPGVQRLCQLLERSDGGGTSAASRSATVAADARQRAGEAVRR